MEFTTRNWTYAAIAASCLSLCHGAAATETEDALADADSVRVATASELSSPRLVQAEALHVLRETARKTHAGRSETTTTLQPLGVRRTATPAMIEKMIELEALPFMKVSDKDSHRVYFGISFDGVLGLHGNF